MCYNWFTRRCISAVKGLRATVIYPATQNQIEKYTRQESLYMVDETYELYQKVTLPYIKSMSLSLEVPFYNPKFSVKSVHFHPYLNATSSLSFSFHSSG